MPKLLNIDELVVAEKIVRIKGVDYTVVERTVAQVICAVKNEQKMTSKKGATELERIEMFVMLVKTAIPDCPEEILRNLPVRTLMVILDYINRNEEVEGEGEEEEGK